MAKFENVEVLLSQSQPVKKSWFARNCPTFAAAGAALMGSTVTFAETVTPPTIPNFLETASTAIGSIAGDLGAFFLIVIGIVLLIAAFSISKGGIKRGSNA